MAHSAPSAASGIRYLSAKEALDVDVELMGDVIQYPTEVLMELAGLSCAQAVQAEFPQSKYKRVVVVSGPGNNGGDGLVCARHLTLFGYNVDVVYPKRVDKPMFHHLVAELKAFEINVASELPADFASRYDVLVDAIFGFSFKGDIRAPFDSIIKRINESRLPVASLDIPSGWDVDEGNKNGVGITNATMLISLTAPKACARHYTGAHYLGGRFIPPKFAEKHKLNLPPYPGGQQFVLLSRGASSL